MRTPRLPVPLVDVLVAPDAAFAALQERPRLGLPLLVLGAATAAVLLAQGSLLEPALRHDPLAADLPAGLAPAGTLLRWLRAVLAVAAAAGVALRALAFGSLLFALQESLGGHSTWRGAVALVLHLEMVFFLESLGNLLLLGLVRPTSLAAVQEVHLRAGIDLFWQPDQLAFAAACTAANAFTFWWGALLLRGVARLAALSWPRAAVVAVPLWLLTVLLRFLLQPR